MMLCRYLAVLTLAITLIVPGSAFAARARKPPQTLSAMAGGAYQNKPIPMGATVWYCGYGGATEILCFLGASGNQVARPPKQIDSRLPPVVGEILNNPERLSGRRIRIPLHGEPVDFELVGQLAEAVMCGSNEHCGVVFAEALGDLPAMVSSFERARQVLDRSRTAEKYSLSETDYQPDAW